MRAIRTAALLGVLVASRAAAVQAPARSGETGILDVPDADTVGLARGQAALEFRLDRKSGEPDEGGPLPFSFVAGLGEGMDLGGTVREGGQPGDERPSPVLFGAALKLKLLARDGALPGAALSTVLDAINGRPVLGTRIAVSSEIADVRLAAFGGGESAPGFGGWGLTAGLAAAIPLPRNFDVAAEAVTTPRGETFGAALRNQLTPTMSLSVGASYFPGDGAYRVSVGFAFANPRPARAAAAPESAPAREVPAERTPQGFTDARPHFRMRMALAGPARLADPRPLRYGPYAAPAAAPAAAAGPAVAAPTRTAVPGLDDLADKQLRDQESLADARERRIRATGQQLDTRDQALATDAKAAESRERELAAREQQLDARERGLPRRGPPTQQQRQLESLEAQLSAQERQLAAQERSLAPAVEAAHGREQDAAAREDAERQEASRLAASVSASPSRAAQLETRKQALGARNRQGAALEAQLVAKGERIDATERQLRVRGERLDTWSRRLDTRSERLDTVERREEPKPSPAPAKADAKAAATPKDKAAFVMVVKSPTAIVKERAATPAPAAGAAVHAGVAVEKAVAAATVVTFPTPATQLSELDRETLDNIARLAAKERCELLIWARAKDPSLMAEAQRRADELRTRAIAAGPLDAARVVTRITTRPGAQGVDVVVSALRETAKPAAAAPATPTAPALQPGEAGKRQLREAVVAAQPSIEACVGEQIERRRLERAEGALKLTVSPDGKVTRVASGGDLAGAEIEECLRGAAAGWTFPSTDAEYVVDVPITVIRGGTGR